MSTFLLSNLFSSLSPSNSCFFVWQAVQASFRVKEIANSCHQQMKEEEGRRNAAVEAFSMAEKNNQELKKKLLEVEKERKYATVALENAEKQSESQRLLLRTVEDNLATSKTQIAALKKKLEEVEKAKVLTEKRQIKPKMKRSSTTMTLVWPRPKTPLGPRSLLYAELTVP